MKRKCIEVLGKAKKRLGLYCEITRVWIKNEAWWGALGLKFEMEGGTGKCWDCLCCWAEEKTKNFVVRRAERLEMETSDNATENSCCWAQVYKGRY